MVLENNILYLLLLLPGFIVYTLTYRLLNIGGKKDPFEATFISLFISILIGLILLYLESIKVISLQSVNFQFGLALFLLIVIFSFLSIVFVKYLLPYMEKLTQIFDKIKWTNRDVLSEVLDENLDKIYGVWLAICTKENKIYTGQLSRYGIFNKKKRGLYLEKVEDTSKELPVKEYQGMFFTDDNIKWISIIKYRSPKSK